MSQAQFADYMQLQLAAIDASGLDPETWIALNAEAFRAAYESTH